MAFGRQRYLVFLFSLVFLIFSFSLMATSLVDTTEQLLSYIYSAILSSTVLISNFSQIRKNGVLKYLGILMCGISLFFLVWSCGAFLYLIRADIW